MRTANARWLVALFGAVVLSACGGGGGSDGPPAAAEIPVSLTNFRATPVRAEVFEGEQVGRLEIRADVEGDLAYLNGKTIYVVVEDPARLFGETPAITINPDGKNNQVTLFERAINTPGRYTGNLRVFVCLDTGCQTQLRNSPQSIPYDVVVLRGLSVPQTPVAMSARFGEPAQAVSIPVTLPDGVQDWQVSLMPAPSPAEPFSPVFQASQSTSGPPTVTVSAGRASTGTFQADVRVSATAHDSRGQPRFMGKIVRVTYEVTRSSSQPKIIFDPSSISFVPTYSEPSISPPLKFIAQGAVTRDTVLLDPTLDPVVNSMDAFKRWVILFENSLTTIGLNPCTSVFESNPPPDRPPQLLSQCLPVGRYTARIRFVVSDQGVQTEAFLPISMEVR